MIPPVRLCRCGCGKPLPDGLHGNARNHPDCTARIRKEQNQKAAKRSRQRGAARRGFGQRFEQIRQWPDVHLPGMYALEITALAARLYEGARIQAALADPEARADGFAEYDDADVLEGAVLLMREAEALLAALVRRMPAPQEAHDLLAD